MPNFAAIEERAATSICEMSFSEISQVTGGLSQFSLGDWINSIISWFTGESSTPPDSGGIKFSASDIGQMFRDCEDHGGTPVLSSSAGSGAVGIKAVSASGAVSVQYFTCKMPGSR